MCTGSSRKYPYLPYGRDFFLRTPIPLAHAPQKIPIPSVGEYGYFVELYTQSAEQHICRRFFKSQISLAVEDNISGKKTLSAFVLSYTVETQLEF